MDYQLVDITSYVTVWTGDCGNMQQRSFYANINRCLSTGMLQFAVSCCGKVTHENVLSFT